MNLGYDFIFIQAHFVLRCLIATLLGAMIGIEREYRQKPAGIKTHVLICLGAMVLSYLSLYFSKDGDPTRIAAQIVSGIGFIGAGTIMHSKKIVHGLTTAATLWVAAAIGMLVGADFIFAAFVVTFLVLPFLVFSTQFSKRKYLTKVYCLSVEIHRLSALEVIEDMIASFDINIVSKSLTKNDSIYLELQYEAHSITQHLFLKQLFQTKGLGEIIKI